MYVDGIRERGRPKKRWVDVMTNDMRKAKVHEKDAQDRVRWKCRTTVANPKLLREKRRNK